MTRDLGLLDEEVSKEEVFLVSNDYERTRGWPLNDGVFDHMVQVHKLTRLELASGKPATFYVEGTPGGGEDSFVAVNSDGAAAPFVEHLFTAHGRYAVRAVVESVSDSGAPKVEVHEFAAIAKVIRYEIRDLSEADRSPYFDTLHQFYAMGQEEGESRYGSTYKSLAYLVREHLYGAADKMCDHWHDDAGMLNHHIGITWEMEESMRIISPATAAHYWDYTREFGLGVDWYKSPIFGDDWFGPNSPANADHVVDTGRFAYTPVMYARAFSDTTNPYGLLRSPWNTNPVPFLMRSNTTFYSLADDETSFPTCSQFAAYVNGSLAEVTYALNGELHGPVHIMIGGHWGMTEAWKGVGNSLSFSDKYLLLSKWLWRQGFVRTPSTCAADSVAEDCMPVCPDAITTGGEGELTNASAFMVLSRAGIFDLNPSGSKWIETIEDYGMDYKDLLEELCHVGWPGDMFTSAAPQDPTFWPLHGNAERFVMYLRVLKKWGVVGFDETWGYHHTKDVPSDTGMVCDWSGVTVVSDMPHCTKGTCPGHKEDDLLSFTNLYDGQEETLLTNAEFYQRIDPYHDDMPYAYDSLSYWEGCTDNNLIAEYNYVYGQALPVDKGGSPAGRGTGDDDDGDGSARSGSLSAAKLTKLVASAAQKAKILGGEEGPGSSFFSGFWGVM